MLFAADAGGILGPLLQNTPGQGDRTVFPPCPPFLVPLMSPPVPRVVPGRAGLSVSVPASVSPLVCIEYLENQIKLL